MDEKEQELKQLGEVILDFQRAKHFVGARRESRIVPIPRKAAVCIGVRRSGKTTFLHQVMEDVLERGVPRENLLYLNFFDDRLYGLEVKNIGRVLDAYYYLYPEKRGKERIYCFFDEIQVVEGWERFVDRVLRTEDCEVYISGSSAELLSKEVATQMRGRSLTWEMFPFSFREYLQAKDLPTGPNFSSHDWILVAKAFEDYWHCGGFPEVMDQSRPQRVQTHQDYFHAILYRDLIERHDISHPKALLDLAHRLLNQVGSLYSQTKLSHGLRSAGLPYQKPMISDFIHWFEDAFFLFSVRKYDPSFHKATTAERKVYCVDHSFVTSIKSRASVDSGHLLENLVFVGLRRVHQKIFYYRTEKRNEVDFIVVRREEPPLLVQVSESLRQESTRKREIRAIEAAMQELGVSEGTIVTRSEEGSIESKAGTIRVVPVWKFLLEQPVEAVL
ncbi:MAG: ATP-binding protein [Planctomycetes bacterium]|nr:ATP-binding protein [Planctomycetota bacterium]